MICRKSWPAVRNSRYEITIHQMQLFYITLCALYTDGSKMVLESNKFSRLVWIFHLGQELLRSTR